jgi:membrane protease YdiL (CAAX protease family)
VAALVLVLGTLALGPFLLQGYFLLSSRAVLAGGLLPAQEQVIAFYDTLPGFLFAATMAATWTGVLALAAGMLSPEALPSRLGLKRSRLGKLGWLVVPIGALALSQAVDAAFEVSGFGRGETLEGVLKMLAGARGPSLALAVLIVGALSATCEELFFRGYLQRRLVARFGPATGILVAAFLFGLAHFDWHHSLFAFAFGVFVGVAAWAADSTWPAVLAHVINNTTAVLTLVLGLDVGGGSARAQWIALAVGVLAAVLAAAWILRRAPRRVPKAPASPEQLFA